MTERQASQFSNWQNWFYIKNDFSSWQKVITVAAAGKDKPFHKECAVAKVDHRTVETTSALRIDEQKSDDFQH